MVSVFILKYAFQRQAVWLVLWQMAAMSFWPPDQLWKGLLLKFLSQSVLISSVIPTLWVRALIHSFIDCASNAWHLLYLVLFLQLRLFCFCFICGGEWGWGVEGKQVGSMDEESQVRGCYNITSICTPTNQETVSVLEKTQANKHLEYESKCSLNNSNY